MSDRGTMSVVEGRTNEQPTPEDAITETSMDHFVREQHEGDGAKSGAAPPNSGPPNSGTASANGMANPDAGRVDPLLRSSPDARVLALVGSKTASAQAALTRASADAAAVKAEQQRREQVAFDAAAQQIREAIQGDKLLEDIASQISIDQTPEGLRIQLLDEDKRPMFALGSAEMVDRARELLVKMTPALMKLSEPGTPMPRRFAVGGPAIGNSPPSAPTPPAVCWWKPGCRRGGFAA